ncbi:MAG TPA: hypothetical protein VE981_12900 [Planctomycetota bacterium]|nr:hypothetical protein [Planctomycetota bacterium]
MSTDHATVLVWVGSMLAVFGAGLVWAAYRARIVLDEWGKSNGFELLSHRECWPVGKVSLGQSLYRVTVRDSAGRRRSGTARCGLVWLGLAGDDVVIRWDD